MWLVVHLCWAVTAATSTKKLPRYCSSERFASQEVPFAHMCIHGHRLSVYARLTLAGRVQIIIKIAAGNGVSKILVGRCSYLTDLADFY